MSTQIQTTLNQSKLALRSQLSSVTEVAKAAAKVPSHDGRNLRQLERLAIHPRTVA